MGFGDPAWEVVRMTGFRISHPFIVRDPGCPPGRHPTRHCGCEVFKTERAAQSYADRMERKA